MLLEKRKIENEGCKAIIDMHDFLQNIKQKNTANKATTPKAETYNKCFEDLLKQCNIFQQERSDTDTNNQKCSIVQKQVMLDMLTILIKKAF